MLYDIFDSKELARCQENVLQVIIRDAFRSTPEPTFRLSCGKISRFYVNCREIAMKPYVMQYIGALMIKSVEKTGATAIGGLTFGADPIACATSLMSGIYRSAYKDAGNTIPLLEAFSIRKELKNHGVIKWIEGAVREGDKVIIIDDVCTTGGSTIKAIDRAKIMGLDVVGVRILIDRQEMGGMDNIRQHAPDVKAIFTIADIMDA